MAKCKICGGAVRAGEVIHSACREREADAIMSTVCDEYCRFPFEEDNIDELEDKHCNECKIAEMLGVQTKSAAAPVGDGNSRKEKFNNNIILPKE